MRITYVEANRKFRQTLTRNRNGVTHYIDLWFKGEHWQPIVTEDGECIGYETAKPKVTHVEYDFTKF